MNIQKSLSVRNKLLATAACVLFSFGAAQGALADPGKRHGAEQRFDYIFNQLSLDDSQRQQVQEIMQTRRQERREIMRERQASGAERPSPEELRANREQSRQMLETELGTVLDAEQVDELLTYMDAHRGQKRSWHGKKRGGRSM